LKNLIVSLAIIAAVTSRLTFASDIPDCWGPSSQGNFAVKGDVKEMDKDDLLALIKKVGIQSYFTPVGFPAVVTDSFILITVKGREARVPVREPAVWHGDTKADLAKIADIRGVTITCEILSKPASVGPAPVR
jgi:hypothetical protein